MNLDLISILTLAYIAVMLVIFFRSFKTASKQYISTLISGLVLLAYSVVMRATNDLDTNWYVLVLALAMIQLSGFEVGRKGKSIQWLPQVIFLVIHACILYFMIA